MGSPTLKDWEYPLPIKYREETHLRENVTVLPEKINVFQILIFKRFICRHLDATYSGSISHSSCKISFCNHQWPCLQPQNHINNILRRFGVVPCIPWLRTHRVIMYCLHQLSSLHCPNAAFSAARATCCHHPLLWLLVIPAICLSAFGYWSRCNATSMLIVASPLLSAGYLQGCSSITVEPPMLPRLILEPLSWTVRHLCQLQWNNAYKAVCSLLTFALHNDNCLAIIGNW